MINFGKSPTKPKGGEGLGLGHTQEGGRSLLSAWCLFSSLWLCGDPCCQPTEAWGNAPYSFWSSLASGIGIGSQAVWRNGMWGSTHSSDAAIQVASSFQRTFQLHLSSKQGRNWCNSGDLSAKAVRIQKADSNLGTALPFLFSGKQTKGNFADKVKTLALFWMGGSLPESWCSAVLHLVIAGDSTQCLVPPAFRKVSLLFQSHLLISCYF